ncbi:MAG: undecaprenyl/decaprenyl-phosphate alpha-N-acetylglucosaminyl 1-phosphate transferase, partial [Acidimicrobiia bacterium]|nr:undecaprenyl/decaprenyl-phosphate alpha-N-acetylglucosaminyl 1-phosphate transferase [Acidimicrobiia bacterium]
IFMGDSGSLLLGTLMAASTMAVGGRTPDPFSGQTFFFYAPLAIPLLILGVPVLDTAFAIIRRATQRQGLATADKDHLHHRLVRLGHGHRRSVGILWAWTALLSAFVLYPTYNEGQGDGIVPFGVAALGLLLYTWFHPGVRAKGVERSGDARRRRGSPGAPYGTETNDRPDAAGGAEVADGAEVTGGAEVSDGAVVAGVPAVEATRRFPAEAPRSVDQLPRSSKSDRRLKVVDGARDAIGR